MTQTSRKTETARSTCRAHSLCNLRVGVRVIVVDVVCVMLVLIARVDVVHAVDTVFVAIFRSHFL